MTDSYLVDCLSNCLIVYSFIKNIQGIISKYCKFCYTHMTVFYPFLPFFNKYISIGPMEPQSKHCHFRRCYNNISQTSEAGIL